MTPYEIIIGDARDPTVTQSIKPGSVQAVVTSPPYWNLRNYGDPNEIGQEPIYPEYISAIVDVFRNMKLVLRPDGVVWLNLGDIYNSSPSNMQTGSVERAGYNDAYKAIGRQRRKIGGMKIKDLVGLPWSVGRGLVKDGWRVQRDYIWHKPNAMPDGATDRMTTAMEHIVLLSLSCNPFCQQLNVSGILHVNTRSYTGAHFATFPPALIRPMILACTRPGDIVLDPFVGSGTTLSVAVSEHRRAIGIDLNQGNVSLIEKRMGATQLTLL